MERISQVLESFLYESLAIAHCWDGAKKIRCLSSDREEGPFDFLGEHKLGECEVYRKVTGKENPIELATDLPCFLLKRQNKDCIVRPISYP